MSSCSFFSCFKQDSKKDVLKKSEPQDPPHTSKGCMIALTASMILVSIGSLLLFTFGQRAIRAGGQHMNFVKSVTALAGIALIPATFFSIIWGISIVSSPSTSLA